MKINEAPKFSETITKQKERHIVTWSQEEDDILREQISIHGTDNWTIIASNFKDKTTRQCRRRWYTYLNSDFKKGGWSPEEDMLLCEAQKLFGNRWTEIAKVVSGRTDNAVKNRFNTLCRKRAKHETISKENESSCINSNDKRVILQNGFITDTATESVISLKKMRTHISDVSEKCNQNERLFKECGTMENKQLRPPFAVIVQNTQCVYDVAAQREGSPTRMSYNDGKKIKDQGTFLKRNDPKIIFLMQQAELLSSLATKVNAENNTQSFENAWKELQLFLNRTQENDVPSKEFSETDFCLEDFKDLIEDLRSSSTRTHQDSRQADLPDESPGCSDNSTESTQQSYRVGEKTEQTQIDVSSRQQRTCVEPQSVHTLEENYGGGCSQDGFSRTSADNVRQQLIHTEAANDGAIVCSEGLDTSTNDAQVMLVPSLDREKDGIITTLPNPEFSSPLQVTPLFQTFAAGMPSPRFSESERNFLLKTLGQESMPANPSQPPPCKRSLLHSL